MTPARRLVLRRQLATAAVLLIAAGLAAVVVLHLPDERDPLARAPDAPANADAIQPYDEVSPSHFSSPRLPALSLDAPAGWQLEVDHKSRDVVATGAGARLVVSTALISDAVDTKAMLGQIAETERTAGFDIGPSFSDRVGELAADGFSAHSERRSACTWLVKRSAHLVTSVRCVAEAPASAREACRPVLATLRFRMPGRL